MNELRKKAADLVVNRLKKATVAEVASDLGVSRQAIYDIKNGRYCPSLSLLQKACEVWKVRFAFGGILIDSASFKTKADEPPAAVPGNLFESIDQLDTSSFEVVQTKPMGRALEVTLRLTPPVRKASGA
ncbi:MAG TPA: helix-turn-helix domain-containing protein [Bryobacteraceae bacterium]|jgi:DNA-binding XRE family transcriptional regulator